MSAELCERAHISKKNAVKNRLELATPQSQRAREIARQYIPHPASSIGKAWESANRPGPTRLKIEPFSERSPSRWWAILRLVEAI